MKEPRKIFLDHLNCSEPRTIGIFIKKVQQDYFTNKGIVRETSYPSGKIPKYELLGSKEKIMVEFI